MKSNEQKQNYGGFSSISFLTLSGLLLILGGGLVLLGMYNMSLFTLQGGCIKEAKLCPDGKTSVGRSGPNCEFALCPFESSCEGGECPLRGPCQEGPGCGAKNTTDISNWKTYRNEKYGFEFKYPPLGLQQRVRETNEGFELEASSAEFPDFYSTYLILNVKDNARNLNTKDWLTGLLGEDLFVSGNFKGGIRADGIEYVRQIPGVPCTSCKEGPISIAYAALSPDKKKIFVFHPVYQDLSYLEYVDRTFQTFKFTNLDGISGWKTYRNEKYGFEFKYPAGMMITKENTPGFYSYVEKLEIWSGKNFISIAVSTDQSIENWNNDCEAPCMPVTLLDLDSSGYSTHTLNFLWTKRAVFKTDNGRTRISFVLNFQDFDRTKVNDKLTDEVIQNLVTSNKISSSAGEILKIYNDIVSSVKLFK